ncbi:MAG TPA: S1/P1 nuclease [Puia sp.]|uniref:S1/P1 nuclease n=1 Tax=Puia sp. TaxID=2045100 RepID=UPI002CF1F107|nr:S1/P1 nuclease [Puia sp.]HVU95986.1 S1/P1 nuclease [Puia sp.]
MKKIIHDLGGSRVLCFVVIALFLLSWGVTGHRTVGKIAERHLTPAAAAAVRELLGSETLADVSTWADEVRGKPEYRQTGPWHYVNLPMGLSFAEFQNSVEGMREENVYSALERLEKEVVDPATPREKKVEALKFIVHFVGDLHQPMHVSKAEDKGGNTVQLNFNGRGTNLHAVWDSKLIDRLGLGYEELAAKVDHATPAQVSQWQKDPMIRWMWESYEVTEKLYAEVDAMKSRSIDDKYYEEHIGTVEQRLEQAGIRLAGVLNRLFAHGVVVGPSSAPAVPAPLEGPAVKIDVADAQAHVGKNVVVTAKVFGYKALEGLTLVNLGAAYPNQALTVVLRGEATSLAGAIDGKTIQVTGKVEMYKGKPEIIVRDPKSVVAR